MKLNWGTGIAIFFSIFVLSLIFQVYKSTQYARNMVSDEYYKHDLQYQKHYEKIQNSRALKQDVIVQEQSGAVQILFPQEVGKASGNIHFFCPSDNTLDFETPISHSTEHIQKITTDALKKGLWRIKIDWQANGNAYFREESVYIN